MADVEVRPVPCTECEGTGKCSVCHGSRQAADASACLACDEGTCYACEGRGTGERYFYRGRPMSVWSDRWRTYLLLGLVCLGTGVFVAITFVVSPPPETSRYFLQTVAGLVFGLTVGPALIVWSLGLRKQDIARRDLRSAQRPERKAGS